MLSFPVPRLPLSSEVPLEESRMVSDKGGPLLSLEFEELSDRVSNGCWLVGEQLLWWMDGVAVGGMSGEVGDCGKGTFVASIFDRNR